jgi:hypothetical protein
MVNKTALFDDLLRGFIYYQYRLENPMPQPDETQESIQRKYLMDPEFHNKIDSLVTGVMQIINKHI